MVRRAEFWGGLFWLAVGAFVTWQGWLLDLGKLNEPGSGFLLFYLGLAICGLAIFLTVQGATSGPLLNELWRGSRWLNVLLVVGALVVFGLLFERLGFVVCTLALLLFLMLVVDPVKPWLAVTISVVASVGVWAVLEKVLRIQLPTGRWLENLNLF
jgi:putative tricarboxylic transport membrane protein